MDLRKRRGGLNMEVLVLSAEETAKALRLKNEVLYKKLERGEIPAFKEGRNWKVPVSTLKTAIESMAINEANERRARYESKMEPRKV